jgi:hypothetical protein
MAIEALLTQFEHVSWKKAAEEPGLLLLGLATVIYWIVFVVYARSKDVGMRWLWLFLLLIPGVNFGLVLVLLFSKSKPLLDEAPPNQALLPTSVTDRAGAPSAPDTGAEDL